jgi:hypothetical protein
MQSQTTHLHLCSKARILLNEPQVSQPSEPYTPSPVAPTRPSKSRDKRESTTNKLIM